MPGDSDHSLRIRMVRFMLFRKSNFKLLFVSYKELSLKFYTILMALSDDLQAVSVDEALIDVTSAVSGLRTQGFESGHLQAKSYEKQVAENIRDRVRDATGCEGKFTY